MKKIFIVLTLALFSQFASAGTVVFYNTAQEAFNALGGLPGQHKGFGTRFSSHDLSNKIRYQGAYQYGGIGTYARWIKNNPYPANAANGRCNRAVLDTHWGITRQVCDVQFPSSYQAEQFCALQGASLPTKQYKGLSYDLYTKPMMDDGDASAVYLTGLTVRNGFVGENKYLIRTLDTGVWQDADFNYFAPQDYQLLYPSDVFLPVSYWYSSGIRGLVVLDPGLATPVCEWAYAGWY